jgi:hypothetical protein
MWATLVLACCASLTMAQPFDVVKQSRDGSAIPDVDKSLATPPPDNSCWLASAANILAAAGWGVGANSQARADNIYTNDLIPHFGTSNLGWSSLAVNWWLLNEGYRFGSPNYNANVKYNDVTYIKAAGGMTKAQYDFLLNQLAGCQYVNVSFDPPTPGHEMTMVGGNFSNNANPASLWNDNTGDVPAGNNTETAINIFPVVGPTQFWQINHRNQAQNYIPNGATILCEGHQKPDAAMRNYDVAYFKDMNLLTGALFNQTRYAGAKQGVYHNPSGGTEIVWGGTSQKPEVTIPNEMLPLPQYKIVYLLVDYVDQNVLVGFPNIANIQLKVGNNLLNPDGGSAVWSADGGQALFTWTLEDQPPFETLVFPDPSYKNLYDYITGLGGPVKDWNVATICVPEPATLGVLVVGTLMVLRRRRAA